MSDIRRVEKTQRKSKRTSLRFMLLFFFLGFGALVKLTVFKHF